MHVRIRDTLIYRSQDFTITFELRAVFDLFRNEYQAELAKLELTYGSGDEIESPAEDNGTAYDDIDDTNDNEFTANMTLAAYQDQSQHMG